MSGLDQATDPQVAALAALCKQTVNANMQPILGVDAIRYCFGSPLPLSLLTNNKLPCLLVYRMEDRDRDKGQFMLEEVDTFRFDYYCAATPLSRIDARWPVLRGVWANLLAGIRYGRHESLNDGADLQIGRYVLGSGKATYTFVPGAEQTYPAFRAEVRIEGCYEPVTPLVSGLDDFLRVYTDWDLVPEHNITLEAQDETDLPQ